MAPFVELPLDLRAQIVHFLSQADIGTLLQLSKAVGEAAAPCLHTLDLPEVELPPSYRIEALGRLLARLSNLRELMVDFHEHDDAEEEDGHHHQQPQRGAAQAAAVPLVIAALREGRVGAKLRRLSLCCPSEEGARELLAILGRGALPCLAELELPDLCVFEDGEDEDEEGEDGDNEGEAKELVGGWPTRWRPAPASACPRCGGWRAWRSWSAAG
jgi:hypothetical protein